MSRIEVIAATKRYGMVAALDDVSIAFEEGEFFGLLGPSGSGKTTLLRAIAGFLALDAGAVRFDGADVDALPVHKRDIGMVFQSYALFPHMSAADNIAFGLTTRSVPRAEIDARVAAILDLVRLGGHGNRRPRELSGGQQQRVALARALVTKPRVLLLDEPLAALDRRLRQEMQIELRRIQREAGVTTIFVTHDQEEALTLSDRVAIFEKGRVVQIGAPREVYDRPASRFAATFLGDATVLEGVGTADGGLRLANGLVVRAERPFAAGVPGMAAIRPEKIRVDGMGENSLPVTITDTIFSGQTATCRAELDGGLALLLLLPNDGSEIPSPGQRLRATWAARHTVPLIT